VRTLGYIAALWLRDCARAASLKRAAREGTVVGYRKNTAELFVILGVVQESETAKQQVELAHDIDHTQSYAFRQNTKACSQATLYLIDKSHQPRRLMSNLQYQLAVDPVPL
jgi:hypothetical protein